MESVSFEEASQLRSFDYLSAIRVHGGEALADVVPAMFMEAKPSQMLFLRCSWRPFGGGKPDQFVFPVCNSGSLLPHARFKEAERRVGSSLY